MLFRKLLLWFLVLLTVVWGAAMQIAMSGYISQPGLFTSSSLDPDCRHPHAQAIGDLELAKNPDCFSKLIAPLGDSTPDVKNDRSNNIGLANLNTRLDLGFIALYWLTFLAFAWLYWPSPVSGTRLLSGAVFVVSTITAVYDVREDLLLFQAFPHVAQGDLLFTTPFVVSRTKWCALGMTALLLGLLPIRDGRFRDKVLSLFLVLSGVAIAAGTLACSNPALGMSGLSIALLIALINYFPWTITLAMLETWLIYAYLLRFQIISALLLAVLLPAGYFLAPSIFYGLFDAIAPFSFFLISFAALLLAMVIMITARLTLAYAPSRFPDLQKIVPWMQPSWRPTCLFSLLAAPMIVLTWIGTEASGFSGWSKLGEILLAVFAALMFLVVTAEFHAYLEDPGGSKTVCFLYPPFRALRARGGRPTLFFGALAAGLARLLPPSLQGGILRPQTVGGGQVWVLRSGHRLAATAFSATLILYLSIGIATAPRSWDRGPAAMFYVLFLLCLLTWFLTGVAFFLDRLRVPVLTALIATSMLVSLGGGTDHVYQLSTLAEPVTLLSPSDVIRERAKHRADPSVPLVVVATAGGGIRASAWTAEVLTGLARDCQVAPDKNNFTSSVVLISSVSGGSEGAMYFAGWYDSQGNTDPTQVDSIRSESAQSDLGAVGWGLLYPDLLRTIPGSVALNLVGYHQRYIDRGWALEKEWNQHWVGHPSSPMLSQWSADVQQGSRPAVIFNATVVESGERFVAATTDLYERELDPYRGTVQFFHLYQGKDLPVSTAARLSATFPFVSPMARADTELKHGELHVGDGGYYDNSGLLSATQWLRGANETLGDYPVILVIIDSTSTSESLGQDWTWQRQSVAPINTLLAVRTSSQQLRAHFEQGLLQDFLTEELGKEPLPVTPAYFKFGVNSTTPLSWHLRADQRQQIEDQWTRIERGKDAQTVYSALHCSGPQK